MKRRGIQLSNRHKRWLYTVTALLFLSGVTWVLVGWLAEREGASIDFFRSLKSWSLKLHGAAAMAFLVAVGILVPTHIRRGWQARRNRKNGAFLVTVVSLLTLTGYGLYYFGDEQWRTAASWIHLILGFAAPAFLVWHIWLGRRDAMR